MFYTVSEFPSNGRTKDLRSMVRLTKHMQNVFRQYFMRFNFPSNGRTKDLRSIVRLTDHYS